MKPAYKITVAGSNITELVADRLISLTLTDEAGVKSDRVELVLDDRDQRLAIPPTKAAVTVAIGYADRLVSKGEFVVEEVEIEGPERRMTIRANAAGASKGAGAARERSWDDTTIGKIARSIAGKHGWTPAVSAEVADIEIKHADQHENDLQFLVRIAADNGAVAKVSHGKLVVAPHAAGKSVSGRTLPVINLVATDTTDWVMTRVERGSYIGVKAVYHDMKTAERGEAIAGEDGENAHVLQHTYTTKAAAQRAAKAKKKALERARDKFVVRSLPGVPELEAEVTVKASGFRDGVDGEWTVIGVTHTITEGGYTCSINAETPAK